MSLKINKILPFFPMAAFALVAASCSPGGDVQALAERTAPQTPSNASVIEDNAQKLADVCAALDSALETVVPTGVDASPLTAYYRQPVWMVRKESGCDYSDYPRVQTDAAGDGACVVYNGHEVVSVIANTTLNGTFWNQSRVGAAVGDAVSDDFGQALGDKVRNVIESMAPSPSN